MTKLQATEAVRAVMRLRRTIVAALAVSAYLFGLAPMLDHASAQSKSSAGAASGITRDNDKRAEREAKRAERAAAREAKKKEREAKRAHKSSDDDDRSYAKAKPSKTGSKSERGPDVDLGDDDPLEGL